MRPTTLLLLLLSSVAGASGCAKEVGRVSSSTESAEVALAAKPVDIWVDMDINCKGDPKVAVDASLTQGGKTIGEVKACNALDVAVKMMAIETDLGGDVHKRYEGKLKCNFAAPAAGAGTSPFRVDVRRHVSENCTVAKLDVVLKQ